MKSLTSKGYIAPGVSEKEDAQIIKNEIERGILYLERADCQKDDCELGESPARVTIKVSVEHRGKK